MTLLWCQIVNISCLLCNYCIQNTECLALAYEKIRNCEKRMPDNPSTLLGEYMTGDSLSQKFLSLFRKRNCWLDPSCPIRLESYKSGVHWDFPEYKQIPSLISITLSLSQHFGIHGDRASHCILHMFKTKRSLWILGTKYQPFSNNLPTKTLNMENIRIYRNAYPWMQYSDSL